MSRLSSSLRCASLLAIGVVCGFGLSVGRPVQAQRELAVAGPTVAPVNAPPAQWQNARLFAEVLEHVQREYVDVVPEPELIEAAIRGMMNSLDPHSAYLGPAEFDEIRVSSSGEYSGVGIEVALQDGLVKVVTPIEESAADRAGVLAGDTLIAIDDEPVLVAQVDDAVDRLRGKAGSKVKIKVTRAAEPQPLEFVLTRGNVHMRSVRSNLLAPHYGYVRITQFSETTPADLKRALTRLRQQNGGSLQGLVLDLRNNPGGVLEAGVAVADVFLRTGLIVSAEGRASDARFAMEAKAGDALEGAPLVVLVNGGSASASEIVAGALRDHRRALLAGRQTYGKGSVQTIVPLSDGNAIKLTTSRYFTPSGESLQKRGITPDVIIEAPPAPTAGAPDSQAAYGNLQQDQELRVAFDLLTAQHVVQARAE